MPRRWREQILRQLAPHAGDAGREERKAIVHQAKSAWLQALSGMDHEDDDPGTTWNERARTREPERMSPRQAWRAIQAGLPKQAIISSDIGNNCAIGNAYPTFEEGRKYLAPGLFGPCGYGFPAIVGAKIGQPEHSGGRLRRRWRLRHLDERDGLDRPQAVAGDHHGDLPQLPMGCGEAQHHAVVRRQFRRHRARTPISATPGWRKPAGSRAWWRGPRPN